MAAFDIRAALAASALIYCLPGCDAAPIESESTLGTLSMPLATEVNGIRYRLTEDRFTISGETIEQELQHNGDGSIVVATLPEGDYEVTLHDGWVLERENDSEFEPIVAELVSPNPRPVRIDSDQTTTVAWLFQTDGTPVGLEPPGLFQGNLAVADSTNPVPQIVGDVLVTEPVHIEALAGIARIEGSLSIQGGVSSLDALSALTLVVGDFSIEGTALSSLAGLANLAGINGALTITNNASLPTCAAEALMVQLGTPPEDTVISGNDDAGVCP